MTASSAALRSDPRFIGRDPEDPRFWGSAHLTPILQTMAAGIPFFACRQHSALTVPLIAEELPEHRFAKPQEAAALMGIQQFGNPGLLGLGRKNLVLVRMTATELHDILWERRGPLKDLFLYGPGSANVWKEASEQPEQPLAFSVEIEWVADEFHWRFSPALLASATDEPQLYERVICPGISKPEEPPKRHY